MKKGMSRAQAEALANRYPAPEFKAPEKADKGGGKSGAVENKGAAPGKDAKEGEGAGKDDKKKEQVKEERTKLPGDIVQQFKGSGVDLSDVPVVKNSKAAADKGVDGFATHSEIHIAPGVDEKAVMRHEAAHVVQFRKGAQGKKQEGKGKNEEKAAKAESGDGSDPGAANPSEVRHREGSGSGSGGGTDGGGESHGAGMPTANFDWSAGGIRFTGAEGRIADKELMKANWEEMRLFRVQNFWPIPAFPVAGLSVMAEGVFAPEAVLKLTGDWAYNALSHEISVTGALKGGISAALTARARAGAALNVIVAEGGIGLEASSTIQLAAEATKSIALKINTQTGAVTVTLTPLEVSVGGTWNAALSLVAWVESWFGDKVSRWTFANFRIATFEGFKCGIAANFGTGGINATVGPVTAGQFHWGTPPEPTDGNAQH